MEFEKLDGGLSALTELLGNLADQFECHAASRGIDQVEEAGRAMRSAKRQIEVMRDELTLIRDAALNWPGGWSGTAGACERALKVPNEPTQGRR